MILLHSKYVVDENEKKSEVLLSVAEWEWLMNEMDDLDGIRVYDAAISTPQESILFELAVREIREWHQG